MIFFQYMDFFVVKFDLKNIKNVIIFAFHYCRPTQCAFIFIAQQEGVQMY